METASRAILAGLVVVAVLHYVQGGARQAIAWLNWLGTGRGPFANDPERLDTAASSSSSSPPLVAQIPGMGTSAVPIEPDSKGGANDPAAGKRIAPSKLQGGGR